MLKMTFTASLCSQPGPRHLGTGLRLVGGGPCAVRPAQRGTHDCWCRRPWHRVGPSVSTRFCGSGAEARRPSPFTARTGTKTEVSCASRSCFASPSTTPHVRTARHDLLRFYTVPRGNESQTFLPCGYCYESSCFRGDNDIDMS